MISTVRDRRESDTYYGRRHFYETPKRTPLIFTVVQTIFLHRQVPHDESDF